MASEPAVSGGRADEKERLDPEDLRDEAGLLASTHLHRYELAAALTGASRVLDLCCGVGYGSRVLAAAGATVHGIDVSADAVRTAEREGGERVTFEQADALEALRRTGAGAYDAIVCFEGIEHVPDPEAVAVELARLAEGGAKLLLSFPNSRGFEERNRFHVTDFGWEETQAMIARFDAPVVLEQFAAEGSLIVPAGGRPEAVAARLVGEGDRDETAWAGHWIVAVGFGVAAVEAASARVALALASPQHAYMRDLERANLELRRANARLARKHLGVHDAAAASIVAGLSERMETEKRRAVHFEAEAEKWEQIADSNDWARKQLEQRLAEPRYAAMDRTRDMILRIPGVSLAARGASRLARRRRR
jgi:2-polyprenyl-3-methyl-5-hydroxy-6-metoxy-1,4-benzoquinol methylase